MARELTEKGAVPGLAIAVVHDDEVVYLGGFGLREMGKAETVGPDTVFQIASMSKPVSSTVVAKLVSEKLVRWDSRMVELNPRFALHDPYPTAEVTLRDLFSHRSGLPGTSGDDLEAIGYDRDAIMLRLRLVPPSSSFRAGYAYSNAGLTQAALAAAMATGKDWETVADELLFRPLGMASTSYRHSDFLARTDRAELHVKPDGAWVHLVDRVPDAQAPAGGVSSTVRDLAEWMRLELAQGAHNGDQVIHPDAIAATHDPLISRGPNHLTGAASFYGLGWNLEYGRHGVSWGHAGAFSTGARSLVTLYPDADLGIVVLTNAFPTGVPEGIAASFFDLVFEGKVVAGLGLGVGRGLRRPVRPLHRGHPRPVCQPALPCDPAAAGRRLRRPLRQRLRRRGGGRGGERRAGPEARAGGQGGLPAPALRPRLLPLRRGPRDAGRALGPRLRCRPGRQGREPDGRVAGQQRPRDHEAGGLENNEKFWPNARAENGLRREVVGGNGPDAEPSLPPRPIVRHGASVVFDPMKGFA